MMGTNDQTKNEQDMANLRPDDLVKSCKYIEMGSCFALDGIRSCVHGTINAPLLVTTEEMNRGVVSHELVVDRRRKLFAAINGFCEGETGACKTCANLKEKPYKHVDFSFLGGEPLTAGMNIQHYTACNQRCLYCCYAQQDMLIKPQYNPIQYFELFRKAGKLRGNNWIDFSGGETTLLKNFEEIVNYLWDHKLGTVVVYSNAAVFSPVLYEALRKNRVILTTSLDTGIASTYRKLHGIDSFHKVLSNLIRYRNSGTHQLWLKYVICESNRSEDDLWSFVLAMIALRPNKVMICPEFPYQASEVPEATVKFAARLSYSLEQLVGISPVDYTTDFGDPLWAKYHQDLCSALAEIRNQEPLGRPDNLQSIRPPRLGEILKNRIGRARDSAWQSGLRERLVPTGSNRERRMVNSYRRFFGRLLGE